MNSEILGIIFMFVVTVVLSIPLGKYIAKVYGGERTLLDPIFNPIERLFFRISGIDSSKEMDWKQHLYAIISINAIWFVYGFIILLLQGKLPLNPDHVASMSPDLAFNTVVSFIVNCNIQHYSGETGMSYFSQIFGVMFFQFVSAGVGMAACAAVFNAMRERTTTQLGNFYNYFIKSCTRILLPVSFITAIILLFNGTPMTFKGHDTLMSLQGDTMRVARGPAAGLIAIKQTGTNGGGFFGANSAHPFENPNYLTNSVENILIILIPIALIFALGYYLKRQKMAWMIFGVMTIGFLGFLAPAVHYEMKGNPAITKMGINNHEGNMEGKEERFGSAASAFWVITTTVTSNGSANSNHDSAMPLTGALAMCGMMVNCLFGGVGVGFLNFYIFIIIAVFISGLMVGRTPELLGKKIEAREMKIATIVALLHPLLILTGTAISSYIYAHTPHSNWLTNSGYHGFSEMLYEYTSSSANNGSEFSGINGNLPFWNITDGVILLLSRYIPIIGPLAIAGLLASKKYIPESAGTLKTDTGTFGLMVFAVIFIIAALAFFPALALGPLAEHFTLLGR